MKSIFVSSHGAVEVLSSASVCIGLRENASCPRGISGQSSKGRVCIRAVVSAVFSYASIFTAYGIHPQETPQGNSIKGSAVRGTAAVWKPEILAWRVLSVGALQ
jgi:hypothetical protein